MRSIMLKAAFVMALLPLAACTAYMLSLQSPFFAKFSLRELIERNKSHLGLNCAAGGGGGVWASAREVSVEGNLIFTK